MSESLLGYINIGAYRLIHSINTADDSTTIRDMDDNILATITRSADVYIKGKLIGHFRFNEKMHWRFNHAGSDEFIDFNSNDLIKSEQAWAKIHFATDQVVAG